LRRNYRRSDPNALDRPRLQQNNDGAIGLRHYPAPCSTTGSITRSSRPGSSASSPRLPNYFPRRRPLLRLRRRLPFVRLRQDGRVSRMLCPVTSCSASGSVRASVLQDGVASPFQIVRGGVVQLGETLRMIGGVTWHECAHKDVRSGDGERRQEGVAYVVLGLCAESPGLETSWTRWHCCRLQSPNATP